MLNYTIKYNTNWVPIKCSIKLWALQKITVKDIQDIVAEVCTKFDNLDPSNFELHLDCPVRGESPDNEYLTIVFPVDPVNLAYLEANYSKTTDIV